MSFRSARDARRAGLALVPQHDLLIGAASVADNLAFLDPARAVLRDPPRRGARASGGSRRRSRSSSATRTPASTALPVGTRQRIEIAGALAGDPDVLILDEPTAVLSPDETAALFASLRKRADAGAAVVLITHRLAEVFAGADRLTLLARGRSVKTCRRERDDAARRSAGSCSRDAEGAQRCAARARGDAPPPANSPP